MRRALLVMVTSLLTACQCGPGLPCSTDTDCPEWGRCSSEGACVLRLVTTDAGADAGLDAGSGTTDAGGGLDAGLDAGVALAELAPLSLDISQAGCGASTTGMVTVTNTGTASLTVSSSTGTSQVFSVAPLTGNVPPGQSLTLTVSALVPATTMAGTDFQGLLTVITNDAVGTREVRLTARASGVTLTLTPSVASFGVVPVNVPSSPLPMTLTNAGNLAATLTLAAPVDRQFSLQWLGMPASVTLAPGASVMGLEAGFTASRAAASSSSALLGVTQPICGASVMGIPMSGQGTNGGVGLSTTDVFFGANGRVDCGARAPNRTFTLTNTGNASFAWTGTLGKGVSSPFTVTPSSGTVPASNNVVLTVSTTAIPSQALTSDDAFGDIFTIVTDVANDVSHPIELHQTANGAILSFAPPSVDFGQVPINNSATAPFSVVNTGNTSPLVSLTPVNPKFTVNPAAPVVAPGGASASLTGTYSPGTSVVMESSLLQLSMDAGEPLCAPLPGAMTMTGQGTSGSVSYSPVALDFGSVNCGATPAPGTVTFRNTGNSAYTVTPVLGRDGGSPYVVSMAPSSGLVAADGGTVVITVSPNGIPQTSVVTPNFYADTLTVTTDVQNDSPHNIPLRLTARGSIFAISASTISFGSVTVGATASGQFTVSNSGNAPGALVFAAIAPLVFGMPGNAPVDATSSSILSATFSPAGQMMYSDMASITKTSATVLCQPLPFTVVSLSGVGTAGNLLVLSRSSLNFGLVPCGTTASAQTVAITNNSASQLALSLALGGAGGSPYLVSGPSTVAAGGMATVTVTPKVVPATSSTLADAFADTLTITGAGGPINEVHTVALRQTAQGAVLTLSPGALSFTNGQMKTFTVNNSGNIPAPYSLALEGTNTRFALSPGSGTVGSGGSATETVTYTKPLLPLGGQTDSVTLSTTAGRCAPLPAPLTLSGN